MILRPALPRPKLGGYGLVIFAALIGTLRANPGFQAQTSAAISGSDFPFRAKTGAGGGGATAAAGFTGHGGGASGNSNADGDAAAAGGGPSDVLRLLQAAKQYRTRRFGGQQLLRHRDINRAMYLGDQERIRSFVQRMAEGQNLTVALVGGSVTKGMGAVAGEPSFEQWLAAWLAAVAPAPEAVVAARSAQKEEAEAGVANGGSGGGWRNSTVRVVNGAVPATSSAYMNMCLREYIRDDDVDLVVVEYAINDVPFPEPQMVNEPRKSFEQLIRKLLRMPKRPAVVILNTYRWLSQTELSNRQPSNTIYFTNAESQFFEFATYYGLPMLSLKAAAYHHMVAGTRGFQVHAFRYETRGNKTADPEALFYEDAFHPSGLTGHRVLSELIVGLLLHVARGLVARPWRQSEEEAVVAPLPVHMLPGNFDTDLDKCLMGDNFRAAALSMEGFEWLNEGRNPIAPKWGYTATTPNATIVFAITRADNAAAAALLDRTDLAAAATVSAAAAAAGHRLQRDGSSIDMRNISLSGSGGGIGGGGGGSVVLIILAYLRSYRGMGVAAVSCEGGCVCGEDAGRNETLGPDPDKVVARLDGEWEHMNSQLQLGCFPARVLGWSAGAGAGAHMGCRVRVRMEDVGRNGTNKVKLGGLIVSHTSPDMARGFCADNLEAAERAAGFRDYHHHHHHHRR